MLPPLPVSAFQNKSSTLGHRVLSLIPTNFTGIDDKILSTVATGNTESATENVSVFSVSLLFAFVF